MRTSQRGIDLIKRHEGFVPEVYQDPVGLDTIGYGTLIDSAAEEYLYSVTLTPSQGEELLRNDLARFEDEINKLVTVTINQNQFDALASFVYNLGPHSFSTSTLLRKLNAGDPVDEIAAEFHRWNKAGGQVLPGLTKRRKEEAELFATPVGDFTPGQKKKWALVALAAVLLFALWMLNRKHRWI